MPVGAVLAGSPPGYQIQVACFNNPTNLPPSSPPSQPIQRAVQSFGSRRPMVHRAGSLHSETFPSWSQTRTFHQQGSFDLSGRPPYGT